MERLRRLAFDPKTIGLWAPALCVAAATQAKLGLERPWSGSDVTLALTTLLHTTPVLARRRWPIGAAAGISAALPVQQALGASLSFASFVAVLVVAFSLGRWATTPGATAGVALILAGVVASTWTDLPADLPELVFPVFYVTAATSLGAVVRRHSHQARKLRELNAALARERDATARLAVATERVRLSRDLHDSVAHTLTVAVVQAERCEQAILEDPEAARSAALAIQEAARHGLAELRSVLRVLRDSESSSAEPNLGDLTALATLMSESGLEVTVDTAGDLTSVPDLVASQLFRVVQESLTNVARHSAATSVNVAVVVANGSATVTVTDPGPAATSDLPSGGHGSAVMAERLGLLGGRLVAGPHRSGYQVRGCVPLRVGADA